MAAPPAELPPDLNPSAPRASFDGLPMEIKARVVEHCAEHDEKWAKLRDHLEECVDAEERPPFKGAIKKTDVRRAFQAATETYVPTIGALFRLSRLWSTLAAPHRFKEVRTSQTDTLLFRHHIVQRRGHLFRKVWFDAHDTTILHNFVLILPHFSAVTEADVTDEGFGGYLDEASETDGLSWTALTDASPFGLATVFGRLTYLKTDITRTEDIVRLASAAPNLRALHLSEVAENDGGLTRIFEILPDLRDFVLKEADSELLRTLNNAMFACGGQLFPPIASLEVDVQDDLSEAMRFAQHFAPSLSTLTFNFTSKTRHDYPDDAVYPNLRSLRLEGQVDEIEALMSCMKREQFPAIVELVVCSDQLGVQMAPSMHEAVKNLGLEMQLLERVRIYDPRCLLDDSDCDLLRQTLENRRIELTTSIVPDFVSSTIFSADDRVNSAARGRRYATIYTVRASSERSTSSGSGSSVRRDQERMASWRGWRRSCSRPSLSGWRGRFEEYWA